MPTGALFQPTGGPRRRPANRPGAWPDYTSGMKNARFALLVLALVLATLLAGCGNKGELVHPDQAADSAADS